MSLSYDDFKIKINGVELPAPTQIDYNLEDLDKDSDRDVESLVLSRNRGRSNLYKITFTYAISEVETVSQVLNMVSPETFSVEIFDMISMKRVSKTMYAGPKSVGFIVTNNIWIKALRFNLIEV